MASTHFRQMAEREILLAAVNLALVKGWKLDGVDVGEDEPMKVKSAEEAVTVAASVDDARIRFKRDNTAYIYAVFGNDGSDVISDYTINLDDIVKGVEGLVELWEVRLRKDS